MSNVKSFRPSEFTERFLAENKQKIPESTLINDCIRESSWKMDPAIRMAIAKAMIVRYEIKVAEGDIIVCNPEKLKADAAADLIRVFSDEIKKEAESVTETSTQVLHNDENRQELREKIEKSPEQFFLEISAILSESGNKELKAAAVKAGNDIKNHPEFAFDIFSGLISSWGQIRRERFMAFAPGDPGTVAIPLTIPDQTETKKIWPLQMITESGTEISFSLLNGSPVMTLRFNSPVMNPYLKKAIFPRYQSEDLSEIMKGYLVISRGKNKFIHVGTLITKEEYESELENGIMAVTGEEAVRIHLLNKGVPQKFTESAPDDSVSRITDLFIKKLIISVPGTVIRGENSLGDAVVNNRFANRIISDPEGCLEELIRTQIQ